MTPAVGRGAGRARRHRAALLALSGAVLLVLVPALLLPGGALPAARADAGDDWAVTRYALDGELAADGGVMDVVLDLDLDFGDEEGHGPYLTLPERQEIPGDPDRYRTFDISDVSATSPSGAPADVETESESGMLVVRVGDEDVEVSGVHSYRISYRVSGLVNPGVVGTDELYWNVIGPGWEVPLRDVSVALSGPADVIAATCYAGGAGSTTPCDGSDPAGPGATFRQDELEPGERLTVVASWPEGTFTGAEPAYAPRRTFANSMGADTVTGSVAAGVTLLGSVVAVRIATRRGRDQAYLGLTPGTEPLPGEPARVGRAPKVPVAVRFTPPDGVRPGEIGTLTDERADPHDVAATLIDLAVRGYLRIEEAGPADDGAAPAGPRATATPATAERAAAEPPSDWRLVRLPAPAGDPLVPYEEVLLDQLFGTGDAVLLSDLGEVLAPVMAAVQRALYRTVTDAGWFTADPSAVRSRWAGIGGIILGVGAVAAVVLVIAGLGVLGIPLLVLGALVLGLSAVAPARTAPGTAVLAQALGFKRYLETAEANQIRFEEGEDVFSRYLPYAVAFGVADRWASIFADLAAQGRPVPEPTWYVGTGALWASSTTFGSSVGAFATSATTAATPGSGGASGSSGGFAGGGVGGGGGGGW
ncbi:DUF2207 domain-containing protein [Georgenia wangjunii]|uniref:DUF2207 domain-containing protein n=1 Tax=Georgenia wangjunii TaxID=3117730 RepID=UPI002F264CC4